MDDRQKLDSSERDQEHPPIYGKDFYVDDLSRPEQSFPPSYKAYNYELSGYESLCVCCGKLCLCSMVGINLATCLLCNCCCNYSYELQTSQGTSTHQRINNHRAGIVQQFGRFTRLLKPGFNYLNPCSEEVISIDMRLRSHQLGRQIAMTKDNIQLTVEAAVYYRPINPIKVAYSLGINNIARAISEAGQFAVRSSIAEYVLQQILTNRNSFIISAKANLQKQLEAQGLLIENLFLVNLFLPKEIEVNLNAAAKQRRLNEANIITSKAGVESAKLQKESSEALDSKAAMQIRYLEMLQEIGNKNRKMTLFIPVGVNKIGKVK